MTEATTKGGLTGVVSQLPIDRLKHEVQDFGQSLKQRGFSMASDRVESLTGRLNDVATGRAAPKMAKDAAEGDSPVKGAGVKATAAKAKDKVKGAFSGLGGGGGGQKLKVTNIVEAIDVPVPRDVAYQQWTQFEEFPTFMKKVESVEQEEDQKLKWTAQILWSHRSWEASITDQVPNERIVWNSEGEKGHVDGAVTFHELTPDLTRIMVVLEYHPKGFFEQTGNLWRAQGRRVRLELRHFERHIATQILLHQDDVDGWQGEIHEGDVQKPSKSSADRKPPRKKTTVKKTTAKKTAGKKTPSTRRTPAKKTAAKTSSGKRARKRPTSAKKSMTRKSPGSDRSER